MASHHAYLLFAPSIKDAAIPESYKIQSADVAHVVCDRLSIDDARSLTHQSQQQPFQSDKRVFVLFVQDIALEAQNALLKLFEEPPEHAVFFVILTETSFLLPTLRSRLSEVANTVRVHDESDTFAVFQSSSYADRMAVIAQRTKAKDTQWIEQIVTGAEHFVQVLPAERTLNFLKVVMLVRTYMRTKGASVKMLLEEIALQVPLK